MGNQTHMAAKIAVNIPHTQNRYILMNGHVIQQIYCTMYISCIESIYALEHGSETVLSQAECCPGQR